MRQTFPCECGAAVPFEEEDRGFEVYCPSCGALCVAPAAEEAGEGIAEESDAASALSSAGPSQPEERVKDEATAATDGESSPVGVAASHVDESPAPDEKVSVEPTTPTGYRSIFSAAAVDAISERYTGETACFCGEVIKVRLEDFGGSVYCPSCGSEVRVGPEMDRDTTGKALKAREAEETPDVPRARFRLFSTPLRSLASLTVIGLAIAGGYWTWTEREQVLVTLGAIDPPTVSSEGAEAEFRPEDVTPEIIAELADEEDPWQALLKATAWSRGLKEHAIPDDDPRCQQLREMCQHILATHKQQMTEAIAGLAKQEDAKQALEQAEEWGRLLDEAQLAEDDERFRRLAAVMKKLIERAHLITGEMIASLLKREDTYDALVDGQVWLEELNARETPEDDPRRPQLVKVIAELERRLIPAPAKPHPCFSAFEEAVQELFERLQAEDLEGAKRAQAAAEKVFQQNADLLANRTCRYLTLKARLRQLLLLAEGVAVIRKQFDKAEELLAGGTLDRITDVVETKARLALLVYITPVTPEESEEFKQRMQKVARDLKFAMGKRAIDDAKRCHAAGDAVAQDRQVSRAHELLPGFPESEVAPLLKQVESWRKESQERSSGASHPAKETSSLGQELARRDAYEAALEHYGNPSRRADFLAAACHAHEQIAASGGGESLKKIESHVLDLLESELSLLLMMQRDLTDDQIVERLAMVGRALAAAEPWKNVPRWKALDGAVRQRGDELAQQLIRKAIGLAREDRLPQAVAAITPALELGLPETAARAQPLHARWQEELKLRADRAAEIAAWEHIQTLVQQRRTLAVWQALEVFVRRYPQGPHRAEANRLGENIRKFMEERFDTELDRVRQMAIDNDWAEVFRRIGLLKAAATTDEQKARLQALVEKANELKDRVEGEYRLLGSRKQMFTPNDIIHVLRVVGLFVAMHPDDEEASALLAEAKRRGAERAALLIEQAKRFRRLKPELFQEKLRMAYYLDPNGKHGAEARRLLAEA